MKKVISFCLWGTNPRYTIGALKNADLAEEIYPDWVCRYYVGKSVPLNIIDQLILKNNTELVIMNEEGDWRGMFWRFYPASDDTVDVMISRDTDSRLSLREKAAVDEWLSSDKEFHIMRDFPGHDAPIMGGMWGVRGDLLRDMVRQINSYSKGDFWQVDQNFLRAVIYPQIRDRAIVHDEFFEMKPFPTARPPGTDNKGEPMHFVGQVFDENDVDTRKW